VPHLHAEHLAASLRATKLRDVDCSVPILEISAGLSIDALSSRELDHCLKGSPSPRYSLFFFGLLLMDRRVYIPEYRPERGNPRTRGLQAKQPLNGTSLRLQQNIGVATSQLRLARHAHVLQEVRLTMRPVRSLAIILTACCSLYRSRGAHGTLSVWTLSSIYPRLTVSPLSWWLLTVCPSNVFSF